MFTATEAVPVAKVVAGNKRYPGVVALDNVNFTLNKGEVRALLGKNGAGKSTLIRMLTGSERPDSGDIWIGETRLEGDEATLTRRAAELGVRAVYQELSLVEGLTVAENLCLGQWPRRNGMIDYLQMAQDAQRCLQALGVDVSPEQLVSTLSPAQKQLVEIARVMKGEPRVVIPLSAALANSALPNSVAINNRLRVVLIFLGIVPPVGFLLTTAYSNYFVMSGSACRSNITVNRV